MDYEIKTDVNVDNDELYIIDDAKTKVSTTSTQFEDCWKTEGTISVDPDPSDNLKIESNGYQIGPDPEKQEKLQEVGQKQLSKLDELKDTIINYISRNEMTRRETEEWKSDLDLIEGLERTLKNALDGDHTLIYSGAVDEDAILDPSQLDTLNDIYRRWT